MLGANVRLLRQALPVAMARAVERKDEIVDRFRLGGDLSQRDADAVESRSIKKQSAM